MNPEVSKWYLKDVLAFERCPKAYQFHRSGNFHSSSAPYPEARVLAREQLLDLAAASFKNLQEGDFQLQPELLIQSSSICFQGLQFQADQAHCQIDFLSFEKGEWTAIKVVKSLSAKQKQREQAQWWYAMLQLGQLPYIPYQVWHINKGYRLGSKGSLFKKIAIAPNKERIQNLKELFKELKAGEFSTNIVPGEQCAKGGVCPFIEQCIPDYANSWFQLRGLSIQEGMEWYMEGLEPKDNFPNYVPLKPFQKIQVKAEKNQEMILSKGKVKALIQGVNYPLGFLDFEGFQLSIPEIKGEGPMQTIPFLFSLHGLAISQPTDINHKYHLNPRDCENPYHLFCEALIKACKPYKNLVVYNNLFENQILNRLKNCLPSYALDLEEIQAKMIDFQPLFEQGHAYHPAQRGKISLKAVSSSMLGENLFENGGVKNGLEACKAYEFMPFIGQQEQLQSDLVQYCSMDTLAMVKLWQFLDQKI